MSMWVCPYCWKMQLDYWELELENESMCFPRTCGNCWAEGLEWYTFEYDDQELITEWNPTKKVLDANKEEKWQ